LFEPGDTTWMLIRASVGRERSTRQRICSYLLDYTQDCQLASRPVVIIKGLGARDDVDADDGGFEAGPRWWPFLLLKHSNCRSYVSVIW
jgi:hypothetical protein